MRLICRRARTGRSERERQGILKVIREPQVIAVRPDAHLRENFTRLLAQPGENHACAGSGATRHELAQCRHTTRIDERNLAKT